MPHALRVLKCLTELQFSPEQCLAVAEVVAEARSENAIFDSERIKSALFEAGFDDAKCDALCDVLRNCFPSQRYSLGFDEAALKFGMVRAKMSAASAVRILAEIEPAIATRSDGEIRAPIIHTPSPGRVVMCDFRFLRIPEMQKERRAIVISSRSTTDHKRCTVVPVSMTEDKYGSALHYRFDPGTYPFFHPQKPVWAICDHQYTVSLSRLWQINIHRKPQIPMLSAADLAGVRELVGTALGLNH